jgi:fatty acid desaturase
VRFRWNFLNLLAFPFAVTPGILRGNARYGKLKGAGRGGDSCGLEAVVVWGVKLGLLALDWRKALCLLVLPQLIANLGIVGINFLWHDGCDPEHPVNHSRNFTGPLLNFLALNNGYHGMHQEEPGLHWSLLPEAHACCIRPGLHAALEQPSILSYAWRTFLFPGWRETFEGKPVTFPDVDVDLDWVEREAGARAPEPRANA